MLDPGGAPTRRSERIDQPCSSSFWAARYATSSGTAGRSLVEGRAVTEPCSSEVAGSAKVWLRAPPIIGVVDDVAVRDLVPDVLPIIGEVDDVAVVTGCLMLIERDLHKYRDWKRDHA